MPFIYCNTQKFEVVNYLLLLVYSTFSDRVGLPLHKIPSLFHSVMDVFFVGLLCRSAISASTLSSHVLGSTCEYL